MAINVFDSFLKEFEQPITAFVSTSVTWDRIVLMVEAGSGVRMTTRGAETRRAARN